MGAKPIGADLALHALMQEGEIYHVGEYRFLVAPVNDEIIEALIVASAATEDDEPNGDIEPSGDERDYSAPEQWTPTVGPIAFGRERSR